MSVGELEEECDNKTDIIVKCKLNVGADGKVKVNLTPIKDGDIIKDADKREFYKKLVFVSCNITLQEQENGEYKKNLVSLPKEWSSITETKINKYHKATLVLTGYKSGVLVLDFDKVELFNNYVDKYPILLTAPIVKSRRGFHIYFNWDKKFVGALPKKIGKLDIQGDTSLIIFAGSSYKTEEGATFQYNFINNNELIDLPNELFEEFKYHKNKQLQESKIIVGDKRPNDKNIEIDIKLKYPIQSQYWFDICNIINKKYLNEYRSWFNILCALRDIKNSFNVEVGEDFNLIAEYISKKGDNFDKESFINTWNNVIPYTQYITAGTLRYYARLSNNTLYSSICRSKYTDKDFSSFDENKIVDYYLDYCGDNLVCCLDTIYFFNGNFWETDATTALLQNDLMNKTKKVYNELIDNIHIKIKELMESDIDTEQLQKSIKDLYGVRSSYGNQRNKNVAKLIENRLRADRINKDIFDTNPYLVCFAKNKAFDLTTHKWVNITKDDYILTTTNIEYIEPTKTQMETIEKLFSDIFPDKENLKSYLSILYCGLSGIRQEKFIVATGGGRNGKGLINDLFQYLMGDYFAILHLSLLTKELKAGANTELRDLHKKRFIKATEPDSDFIEKLRMSNIKALTGESKLKARGLYEKNFEILLLCMIIMECNKLPNISMDGNEAEKQRLGIIPFETTFTDSQEDIDNDPENYKRANPLYKTIQFKETHACALFKYIVDNAPRDFYLTEKSKTLAMEWLAGKDEFLNWFYDTYEMHEGSSITIKDLFRNYKHSSNFNDGGTKAQKRQNTEKNFREMVKSKLKLFYVASNTTFNGTYLNKDIIKNFREKQEEED